MCLSIEVELKTGSDNMGDRSGSVQGSIGIPDRNGMFERFLFQVEFLDGFFIDTRNSTTRIDQSLGFMLNSMLFRGDEDLHNQILSICLSGFDCDIGCLRT